MRTNTESKFGNTKQRSKISALKDFERSLSCSKVMFENCKTYQSSRASESKSLGVVRNQDNIKMYTIDACIHGTLQKYSNVSKLTTLRENIGKLLQEDSYDYTTMVIV